MVRVAVALLAKERACDLEQLVLIGPVRTVAVQAIFPDRSVLPEERTAFFRMTGVTKLVHGVGL